MTDLSPSVWREIEKAAYLIGNDLKSKCIELGRLRNILNKARRSDSQNATLWRCYQQIIDRGGEELRGFTKDDLHEFFLISWFGSETLDLFGKKRLKPLRRSSRLSKAEFADFLDHIVQFMAERSVVLDMPGDEECQSSSTLPDRDLAG